MDLNLDYSDDESPLSLKSDFILSLCELIVGGKEGLQPVQKLSLIHIWSSGSQGLRKLFYVRAYRGKIIFHRI